MVYTVFYKTSSFAGYCFLSRNIIHPQRRGVFSFKPLYETLVKFQICSFIVEEMFTVVYTYLGDLSSIFDKVIECARAHRKDLRFIYQVATSPQYGEELRELAVTISEAIDSFSIVLAERLNCDQERLRRIVHLIISVVLTDIDWEKSCESQIQYDVLYQMMIDMQR